MIDICLNLICKSGLWEIRLHEEFVPWIAFTCSKEHFE